MEAMENIKGYINNLNKTPPDYFYYLIRIDFKSQVVEFEQVTHLKIIKGVAIDIDHRVRKQQYTTLLPLNGVKGGRKTSYMACTQKKN